MNNELPDHYSLVHEKSDHFMVHDKRTDTAFPISKKELHPATQMKVLRLPKYCGGGDVTKMADGGDITDSSQDNSGEKKTAFETDFPNFSSNLYKWFNPSDTQTPATDVPQSQSAPVKNIDQTDPFFGNNNGPGPQPSWSNPTTNPSNRGLEQAQAQNNSDSPMANINMAGYPTVQGVQRLQNMETAGINEEAKAKIQQNQALIPLYEQHMKLEQERQEAVQQKLNGYQQQQDDLYNKVLNSKIDPDQYWQNHSRVAAAIGMMVAGVGAGLQHSTTNLAMKTVEDGINRNIESQKAELGKNENLLSENLRIQGNIRSAEDATRLQSIAAFQGQLNKSALETGNPLIIAQAKQQAAQIGLKYMPLMESVAQNQVSMGLKQNAMKIIQNSGTDGAGLSNADPSVLVHALITNPEDRKTAFEEIKNRSNISQNGPKMLEAFDKAADQVKIPGWERSGQLALHQLLLPNFKSIDGTVRQAAMDETFNNVTPSMLDGKDKLATKRKALQDWIKSESATPVNDSYGIPLNKFSKTAENLPGKQTDRLIKQGPYKGKIGVYDSDSKQFLGFK